jgi:large subunit ribosomal protein L24
MQVKKGDNVKVLTGKDRGKSGKIVRVLPKLNRVIVEGINKMKRHERPRKSGEKGTVKDVEMPIHVSNVKKVD